MRPENGMFNMENTERFQLLFKGPLVRTRFSLKQMRRLKLGVVFTVNPESQRAMKGFRDMRKRQNVKWGQKRLHENLNLGDEG